MKIIDELVVGPGHGVTWPAIFVFDLGLIDRVLHQAAVDTARNS